MLFRGIRSRLLALALATVIPFTALISLGLWTQWRNDRAAAAERAFSEARVFAAQVDDHLGNLDSLLVGLSRAVSTDPADSADNDATLMQLKQELPAFISNIFVFAPDGTNIGIAGGARFNAADRAYFQKVLAGQRLGIGEVLLGRAIGQWVITVARPVKDETGRLKAVLAIGTLLEHFQDALRVRQLPAGSVLRIVNEHGVVIAQTDNPSLIGRDLSDYAAPPSQSDGVDEAAAWPDHVQRITASATAHMAPWVVTVGLPKQIAYAAVSERLGWGALFSAIALMIAVLVAGMLAARILRPLAQLGRDASVLAAGELSHRTQVRTRDEIGVLADAFNKMATSLERRQEEADRAAFEVREAKDTLATIVEASPVAIICSDPQRRIMIWNRSAEQIFGFLSEETIGRLTKLVPREFRQESQALFDRAMRGETVRDVQVKRLRRDGTLVDVRLAAAPMTNPDGTVRGVAWAYEDITDRKRAEEQLAHLAHYDPLTGLPNRLTLQSHLASLLQEARPVSVALFDLDGFKDVNDTLGHSTGDQLLVEVGRRLSEVAAARGRVCRLGGDEFVVVLPDCGDPRVAAEVVDAMLRRLADPYEVNDHVLHLGGSAGIAIAPNDGDCCDDLIANADLALYQAKESGGRVCRFYLPVLRAQAQARRGLDAELRRAFASDELELYFQPQVRLADETVIGAEALLRWRHPVKGVLAPGAFIETLAESAIAPDVGRWIIRSACVRLAAWRAAGLPLGRMSVNLFSCQLRDESLLRDVDDVLRATGLPADALEIEITENIALNHDEASPVLQKLRERGVKLAFDDFGTGFASLSYLTKFPLSRIKIDRSFVGKVTDDAEDAAIVRSLISMAHNLGLEVIAEGVETAAQAAFLVNERCEAAQGYLYGKPLAADAFEALLRTRALDGDLPAFERRFSPKSRAQVAAVRSTRRRRLPKG
ncbi:MAG TPA: EAL domain-containing protein [Xanthobacteraceae bacterium]|nr:EAL domain-containing protein [Xanthobacteraceae bacterium]